MRWLKETVAVVALISVGLSGLNAVALAQEAAPPPRPALADLVAPDDTASQPADDLLPAEDLDTLVAPVALYPDALLAQVLVAATFPLQVVKADRLLSESSEISDDEMTQRIADENWDPSVVVLTTGFPTVIERMADDLDWTEQLGTAMVAQDEDVLAAVQRMRTEARTTGYLTSNSAQVVEDTGDSISIRPADPDVIYVPSYDPATAYVAAPTTEAYVAPRSNPLANPLVAGAMAFGAALLVTELFGNDDDDDGWNGYWRRPAPIDWQDRQFYPRPGRWDSHPQYAWSRERDDAWDRDRRAWRPDPQLTALRADERRAALAHIERDQAARAARLDDVRRATAPAERQRLQAQSRAAAQERQPDAAARQNRQQAATPAPQKPAAPPAPKPQQAATPAAKKPQPDAAARQKEQADAAAAKRQQQAEPAAPKAKAAEAPAPKKQQAETPAPKKQQADAPAPKRQQADAPAPKKQQAEAPQPKTQAAEPPAPKKQQAEASAPKKKQPEAPAPKKQQAAAPAPKQQAAAPAPKKQAAAPAPKKQAAAPAPKKQQAQAQKAKPAAKRCKNGQGKDCKPG